MLAPSTNSQKSDADLALTSALAAALLPHFQVALTTTAADTEAALALELMKRSASVPVVKRLAATPVSKPSSPPLQVAPPLPPGAVPRYTIRRDITCATYLRRLHVTGEMVRMRGRRVWESRGASIFFNAYFPPSGRQPAARHESARSSVRHAPPVQSILFQARHRPC